MNKKWLSELWHYREVVYFLAWRDIKVRYKQAALGAAWAIVQPLATMLVFTFIFGRLPGISGVEHYALMVYIALVLWTYFAGVIAQAGQCLVSNSNLITKVYFPRMTLPISTALAALLDLAVGLSFLVVLLAWYGVQPGWMILWAPFFLVQLLLLTVGIGLLLSALNVQYRDVKYAVPFVLQIWLFGSPVIYPLSIVGARYHWILWLNPMTGIIEGFRACILPEQQPDLGLTAISLTVTLLIFLGAILYFHITERAFADVI